jgi:hypothetical protein
MRRCFVTPDGIEARAYPDHVQGVILTTSPQAIAISTAVTHAFFKSEVAFAVAYNATAGTTTAAFSTNSSSACELNPDARYLGGAITELSVIGRSTGYLSIAQYDNAG